MTIEKPPLTQFIERLGFSSNPFQTTNADEEPRLDQYFVAPPYFNSVYGDPTNPASCMVFAPRGAGKSAQRKMVEITAPSETILCITYDTFRRPGDDPLVEMTLSEHLFNTVRSGVVGMLTWLGENREAVGRLDGNERRALTALALGVLSTATRAELEEALHSLRNLSTAAKALWNEHSWVLNAVLASVNVAVGGPGGTLPMALIDEAADEEPGDNLDLMGRLASKLGLQSIYVLIDRVDETRETTADPESAYEMIAPVMHELRLLEQRPFAFKFFLPDNLLPFYQQHGGRSDRIRNYETRWRNEELREMIRRRLAAHSEGRVDSMEALLAPAEGAVDRLVNLTIWIAQKSPRDLIRIWGRAVDEQLRADPSSRIISRDAVLAGIDTFCDERADEVATAAVVGELKRVARVDFTVSELASDVYHVEANSARARIQGWEGRGVVQRIGEVPVPRGRPHRHYGVVDARVARAMFPDVRLERFLESKARQCPNCESWVLRDYDSAAVEEETCVECGITLISAE